MLAKTLLSIIVLLASFGCSSAKQAVNDAQVAAIAACELAAATMRASSGPVNPAPSPAGHRRADCPNGGWITPADGNPKYPCPDCIDGEQELSGGLVNITNSDKRVDALIPQIAAIQADLGTMRGNVQVALAAIASLEAQRAFSNAPRNCGCNGEVNCKCGPLCDCEPDNYVAVKGKAAAKPDIANGVIAKSSVIRPSKTKFLSPDDPRRVVREYRDMDCNGRSCKLGAIIREVWYDDPRYGWLLRNDANGEWLKQPGGPRP